MVGVYDTEQGLARIKCDNPYHGWSVTASGRFTDGPNLQDIPVHAKTVDPNGVRRLRKILGLHITPKRVGTESGRVHDAPRNVFDLDREGL
jgi:hypothetical protein